MRFSLIYLALPIALIAACGKTGTDSGSVRTSTTKPPAETTPKSGTPSTKTTTPPTKNLIINDGCRLDDKITSLEIRAEGKSLLNLNVTARVKANEDPMAPKLRKLFSDDDKAKEYVVTQEFTTSGGEKLNFEYFTDPTKEKDVEPFKKAVPNWLTFDLSLTSKSGSAVAPNISHVEGIGTPEDPTGKSQGKPAQYLFASGSHVEFPLTSEVLLRDIGKLSITKKIIAHKVKNSCPSPKDCGVNGINILAEEAHRFQVGELEVLINGVPVYQEETNHIFSHLADEPELKDAYGKTFKNARSLSLDLAASATFKQFLTDETARCASVGK